jgi:pyridoxal phosphate enzyme (YggS family)
LFERYRVISEKMRAAAVRAGRAPESVVLLGVTKTVDAARINRAIELGVAKLGENRVQEAIVKRPELQPAEQHLIGALQTNKARKAIELFDVIQSLDRSRLAETLDRVGGEMNKIQRCLVEVKITNEPTKSGVPLADAEALIDDVLARKNLKLEGLMTIGELGAAPQQTHAAFAAAARFFESQKSKFGAAPVLSMGMSDDFEIAIEEGSTMVRIGTALFGARV